MVKPKLSMTMPATEAEIVAATPRAIAPMLMPMKLRELRNPAAVLERPNSSWRAGTTRGSITRSTEVIRIAPVVTRSIHQDTGCPRGTYLRDGAPEPMLPATEAPLPSLSPELRPQLNSEPIPGQTGPLSPQPRARSMTLESGRV